MFYSINPKVCSVDTALSRYQCLLNEKNELKKSFLEKRAYLEKIDPALIGEKRSKSHFLIVKALDHAFYTISRLFHKVFAKLSHHTDEYRSFNRRLVACGSQLAMANLELKYLEQKTKELEPILPEVASKNRGLMIGLAAISTLALAVFFIKN
jgi:hypothetical protein